MKKRQVVFIMTDTTRFDMLGCYGNQDMKTPNLDALAAQGVRCTRAYTCQPVCGPARSALFTGLFPHSNGSFTNSYPLGDNVKTLGQRLTDNGIKTGYVGKWHLDGGDYFGLGRCPDGWDADYWYDMKCYLDELSDEDKFRSRQESTNQTGIDEGFTYAHRCVERARKFVDAYAQDDFFLTLSLDEPHDPSLCPEPFASMYQAYELPKAPNVWDTLEGKPTNQKIWAGKKREQDRDAVRICRPSFFGCNSFADYEIGRMIDHVKAVAPDAVIFFTSDHGDALESHCLEGKGASMYDEIARVPFIAYGFAQNKVCESPVSHINVVPTVLEYMGVPLPKLLEGSSILRTLQDPSVPANEFVFTEFTRYEVDHDGFGGLQMMRAVFDGRYKLVVHLLDEVDELYDLATDPYEMVNCIDAAPLHAVRDQLHDVLLAQMNQTRDPFRGYQWKFRPWRQGIGVPTYANDSHTRQRENEEYEPRQREYLTGLPMVDAVREIKQI